MSKIQEASDYLEKFLPREIDVVKGLKHDNLIKYFQAIETTLRYLNQFEYSNSRVILTGNTHFRVYIIMEFADHGSLLDIIKRDTKIDEDRARKWFIEATNAVEYCHSNGVVHR